MKSIIFILLLFTIHFTSPNCMKAQSDDDKQVEIMLKEFYTAYNKVWENGANSKILTFKLDSLMQIYCSEGFKVKIKKINEKFGLDHDIFTNDYGTNKESLKTLTIKKDSAINNNYIVSYNIITLDPSNKEVNQAVTIHVMIIKGNKRFEINDVWNSQSL